jgi:hypothetical protein
MSSPGARGTQQLSDAQRLACPALYLNYFADACASVHAWTTSFSTTAVAHRQCGQVNICAGARSMCGKQQSLDRGGGWSVENMEKVGESTEQKKFRRRRLVPSRVSRHLARPSRQTPACMAGACSIKLEIPRTLSRVSESGVLRRSSNRHRERAVLLPSPHSPDPNRKPLHSST